jgi:hypothetical protein
MLDLPKANINAFSVSPQRRVVAIGEQNPCVLVLQSKYFDYPPENKYAEVKALNQKYCPVYFYLTNRIQIMLKLASRRLSNCTEPQ